MQIKLLQGASTVWMREAVCDMAQFLYQTIEALEQAGFLQDMPDFIEQGLSERIDLRDYQRRAFRYFITYYENENLRKNKQIHTLFHMATGERVIIVTGCINVLVSRVSGTLTKYNSCIA
jgi:type III restriction enzyme